MFFLEACFPRAVLHSIAQVPWRPSLADRPPGSFCSSGLADTLPSLVEDPGGPSLPSSPGSPETACLLGFGSVPGPGCSLSAFPLIPSSPGVLGWGSRRYVAGVVLEAAPAAVWWLEPKPDTPRFSPH